MGQGGQEFKKPVRFFCEFYSACAEVPAFDRAGRGISQTIQGVEFEGGIEMNVLTKFEKPDGARFESCYGLVTWREWLAKEMEWAARLGRSMKIVKEVKHGKKTGCVALARGK